MLLKANGLGDKRRAHSKFTLPSPKNRFGDTLTVCNVHQHQVDILSVGFSWPEVTGAAAIQMPSDPKKRAAIEDAVARVYNAAGRRLPTVVPGQAEIEVAACTHTNAGLHCAWEGVRTDHAELGVDGLHALALRP